MDTSHESNTPETWIGLSLPRKEDPPLLTGAARFMDDLTPVGGIRHAAILRSPHAHAEIVSIDVTAAEKLPGVLGVVIGRDVAALSNPIANLFGLEAPYYPCAVDRVRYYGEPVAVVVAEDRYVAEDALELIVVNYRPLPPVVDPQAAAEPDAPKLHDALASNVVHQRSFSYGAPDESFAAAAHVVSVKTHYPRVTSTPMETFGVIAHFERAPDRYTVWSNFQGPFTLYPLMCSALKVPSRSLRLISPPSSGGSFGIKQAVYPFIVLMAVTSRKFGVPVKWIEDRLEHLAGSSCASDRVVEMIGAFSADGKLDAVTINQLENVGAYLRSPEPAGLYRFHATLNGPYDVRNFKVSNRAVVTNQMPTGLNRGYGGAQYCYPFERLMHRAAVELGIDPLEIRRRNLINANQFPYECVSGGLLDSGDYHAALELALKKFDYNKFEVMRSTARAEGRIFGIGIGCTIEAAGSNLAYVNLALTPDERETRLPKSGGSATSTITIDALGSVVIRIDGAPAGQGHETVVAQIVAEELGVHPDDVTVVTQLDTLRDSWSVSSGNYANRFSTTVVGAAGLATRAAAAKLKAIAAPLLGVLPENVVLRAGKAHAIGGRNIAISIRQLAAKSHWDTGGLPEGVSAGVAETKTMTQLGKDVDRQDRLRSAVTYSFQFDVAAVEVDPKTSLVKVLNYVSVHDAGRLLNPQLADGQIYGGFAHGLGAAMSERITYSDDGTLLTTTFQDYMCISAVDMPPFTIGHVTSPSPHTLYGSKGLGDGCAMLTPAVIANALDDALGIKNLVPPFSPAHVWALMSGKKAGSTTLQQERPSKSKRIGTLVTGSGTANLKASPDQIWRLLFDTGAMARLLPGCRELSETSPDHFETTIRVNVAGIGGDYKTDICVKDKVEDRSAVLECDVKGNFGFGEGTIAIALADESGLTRLTYTYEGAIGGKAASIGQRMLGGVMRLLINEFFERMKDQLEPQSASSLISRLWRRIRAVLQMLASR